MITKTYTTGSFDRYGESRGYVLELVLTEESADTAANTSTVAYKLQLRSGSGNRFDWELTSRLSLNGQQVAAKTEEKYLDYNSVWVLLSGSTTVSHAEDGTLELPFSATVTPWNGGSGYTPPALSLSGTMALTQIPRASAVAATSVYIGDGATIVVSRKSTDFTHSIGFAFGGLSGYLADAAGTVSHTEQRLTATTLVFPVPESFYAEIPDAPSGICRLTCKTYAGDTLIGEKTAAFTVTADPARCAPLLTATAKDVNESTLSLTGDSHIFVQGRSRVQCDFIATARCGAAIAQVLVNGKSADSPCVLEDIQTDMVTLRAVDTRGYFVEYTVPGVSFVPYVPLSFYAEASRTDPTSGGGTLTLTGKWYDGSFGAVQNALSAQYRVDGGQWTDVVPQTENGNISARLPLKNLDYRTSHSIEIQLSDCLETVTKTARISKGIPVFDWGESDVRFHVPVIFTAPDGTRFTLTLTDGQLKGEIYG